jgi:hypothetical protein
MAEVAAGPIQRTDMLVGMIRNRVFYSFFATLRHLVAVLH